MQLSMIAVMRLDDLEAVSWPFGSMHAWFYLFIYFEVPILVTQLILTYFTLTKYSKA